MSRFALRQSDVRITQKHVLDKKKLNPNESGRQEMLENIINQYL